MRQLVFDIGKQLRLDPSESGSGLGSKDEYQSIGAFISSVLPNVYVVAGIILFVILVVGGIMVIINAGQGDEEKTAQGKKAITAAVIGLVIVLISWWIMKIIEVLTGAAF